jgi:hypothetical protein
MFPVGELIVIVRNVTVSFTTSDFVESWVEIALIVGVAAPVNAGVKVTAVPELTFEVALSVPADAGLTERFTVFVNAPVPATVGVQLVVCASVRDVAVHASETFVIATGTAVTVIAVGVEDIVVSLTDFAVTVAGPTLVGVKTPALVTVPSVAVYVTLWSEVVSL